MLLGVLLPSLGQVNLTLIKVTQIYSVKMGLCAIIVRLVGLFYLNHEKLTEFFPSNNKSIMWLLEMMMSATTCRLRSDP